MRPASAGSNPRASKLAIGVYKAADQREPDKAARYPLPIAPMKTRFLFLSPGKALGVKVSAVADILEPPSAPLGLASLFHEEPGERVDGRPTPTVS